MPNTSFTSSLADLVIANGAAITRSVEAYGEYSDAASISIIAPAALDALTYTLEVSFDGSTWVTLNDGSADIGPPAAGKGRQYTEMLGFHYWRIKASGNATGAKTFKCAKLWIG